jgi:hypothetical protein
MFSGHLNPVGTVSMPTNSFYNPDALARGKVTNTAGHKSKVLANRDLDKDSIPFDNRDHEFRLSGGGFGRRS